MFVLYLLYLPISSIAQSDEINISASFAESIELRITNASDVSWTFRTINDYTKGFWPLDRQINYEISSSVNFIVQLQITPMVNGEGEALDMGNISLRPGVISERLDQRGTLWEWADGDVSAFSNGSGVARGDLFFGDQFDHPKTLIVPGPQGNAGGFEQNKHKLLIGIGRYEQTKLNGMPTMLDQNISPGVYTGTVVLTALASVI